MEEKWKHIIEPSSCPDEQILWLYLQNKLDEKSRFEVEHHLTDCDMCNDVLEGFSNIKNFEQVEVSENELKQRIHHFLNENKRRKTVFILFRKYGIAASILLITGISISIYFSNLNRLKLRNENTTQVEKSYVTEKKKIIEIEKPVSDKISVHNEIAQNNPKPNRQILNKQIQFKAPTVVDTVVYVEIMDLASETKSEISMNSTDNYEKKNIEVSDKEKQNATLNEETKSLEEVVVVGSGTQKKSIAAGAVASMKADDIMNVSDSDAGFRLNKALNIMKSGDTITAMDQMRDIAKGNRKYIAVWHNLTIGYLAQHDKTNAIKSLNKILKLANSDRIKKKINEILKLSKDNKLEEALKKLRDLKPDEY